METKEANSFRKLLDELNRLGHVATSYVDNGQVIYKITDKGKKTIENLRDPLVKEFLSSSGQEI